MLTLNTCSPLLKDPALHIHFLHFYKKKKATIVADLQQLDVVLKHNDAFTFVLSELK